MQVPTFRQIIWYAARVFGILYVARKRCMVAMNSNSVFGLMKIIIVTVQRHRRRELLAGDGVAAGRIRPGRGLR